MLRRNKFGKISKFYLGIVRNGINRIKEKRDGYAKSTSILSATERCCRNLGSLTG
jgi:hypothetical protein